MLRNTVFVFIVFISVMKPEEAEAQQSNTASDLKIIHEYSSEIRKNPKRHYLYKNDSVLLRKLNPVNALAGSMLYVYQNVFSRQISSNCIYNPSCSDFSKSAILQYGLVKGSLLSADRLWRCNSMTATELKDEAMDLHGLFPDPPWKYHYREVKTKK